MCNTLTAKQKRFCEEYIVDFNATQAAIRSGYSKNNADKISSKLVGKSRVQEYITELTSKLSKKSQITAEKVLAEYAKLAFSDITDYLHFDSNGVFLYSSQLIESDKTAAISEVSQTETLNGINIKFKLHDKKAALDSICKMLGYNAPDKIEANVTVKSFVEELINLDNSETDE